jgi:dihydroorotate dehydrogenase electron transfer subunit
LKQLNARVISNAKIFGYPEASYFLLRVYTPEIAAAGKPGQFCMLKCGKDPLLRRPVSIHAAKPSGEIHFLYDDKGKGKTWLSNMAAGSELDIIGPLGNGFKIDEKANNILIAAGGIGIAPLVFLAEKAIGLGKNVTLLHGARCREGLFRADLLPSGIEKVMVVERPENSGGLQLGRVTDFLPEYIDSADQVFACGPQGMLEAIGRLVDNKAITQPVQVSLEVRMGCGLGTCYGCSIKTRRGMQRVCKEGPVFNIKDIIWQEVTL